MKRPKDRPWQGEVSAARPAAPSRRRLRSGIFGGNAPTTDTPGEHATAAKRKWRKRGRHGG